MEDDTVVNYKKYVFIGILIIIISILIIFLINNSNSNSTYIIIDNELNMKMVYIIQSLLKNQ